jgi:hypothetical protein
MIDNKCGAVTEGEFAKKPEILRENLPNCQFFHHKSHISYLGVEYEPLLWETGGSIRCF